MCCIYLEINTPGEKGLFMIVLQIPYSTIYAESNGRVDRRGKGFHMAASLILEHSHVNAAAKLSCMSKLA